MREPIIFPHEMATLKDILLLTPEGFCRVRKLPCFQQLKQAQPTNQEQLRKPMSQTNWSGYNVKVITHPILHKIKSLFTGEN